MNKLISILDTEFDLARQAGNIIDKTISAEAEFLGLSIAHLSRVRNVKSPLTEDVINRIVNSFKKTTNDVEELKSALRGLMKEASDTKDTSEKNIIGTVTDLFEKLSNSEHPSLLLVDFRDFPQSTKQGAIPILAEKAADAICKGLCYGLFQPFGTAEALSKMIETINKAKDHPKKIPVLKAYVYLYELASKVREAYLRIKELCGEEGGRIVLYEAQNEKPMITGIGLQSRLFLTNYYEGEIHQKKIFQWITALNNEHHFIERSQLALNIDAVRLQFHPVPKFWETQTPKRLPIGTELENCYKNSNENKEQNPYNINTLLGEEVKQWKDWSESKEEN